MSATTPTSQVRTVCSYCGVGCGMVLDIGMGPDGRRTVLKASGDKAHPANFGRLCTKGATTADMLAAPGRLATALVRDDRGAEPVPAPVDAAIAETARRLRAVIDEHGPDAFAFYVSGQMSLEAQYLANKLAKGFVRTNQIESNSRLCMASAGAGYKLSLGADGPPGSYQDFEKADVFLVIGSNMADCHPILFLRMMDRVKSAGAKVIVVDPRRTATADKADLFLRIKPGADLALLNGLLHLLHENGHTDPDFIAAHTEGWEAMTGFLADYPPAAVAETTGIPEDDIREAARLIGEAGEWMSLWTMGLNQSTHGTWNTNALVNLHLATGAICRPGSGPFSLTGQPNAMGGREMGYMGPGLPGQRSVLVDDERAFVEELWELPPDTLRKDGVGKGTVEMFQKMADGEIKACWIICTNPVASVANRRTVIEGLEAAEFVVTQDVFAETETNAYADVVLPGAMWTETEGVLINSERNLTLAQGRRRAARRGARGLAAHRAGGLRDGVREGVLVRERGGDLRGDQARVEPEDRVGSAGRDVRPAAGDVGAVAGGAGGRGRPESDSVRGVRGRGLHGWGFRGHRWRGQGAGVSHGQWAGRVPCPAASARRRDAGRRLSLRAEHRAASASVAHADQDGAGGQAQQARSRAVRGGASGGRRGARRGRG